ncbi:MFS transporter [Nocardia pseudobrasiliensis]|uniref:MFS transporter n=1 Tax=Nocardia pseudobrasiliensis TaxID=45979 RepID=UPI001B860E82|nr:MFS transporter [Nocardia pseudobrasiliensis]
MSETLRRWVGVVCLSAGIFTIVTSEILPIGLLNSIVGEFKVSAGTGGLLLTLPGFVALICAPVAVVVVGRFDRRVILAGFMGVLAGANLLVAVAPNYGVVLVGRALVGVVIGGYWSIGAGLSPRLVKAAAVPTATAIVFAAVPIGSVLGVPLGTQLGQGAGWRVPFAVLCGLSAVVAGALVRVLPPLPVSRTTSAAVLFGLLREPGVRSGLVVTALVVVAQFGAYTYVAPLLRDVAGIGSVGGYLFVYGIAGVVGTLCTSRTLVRGLRGTFAVSAVAIAVAVLLLPVLGRWPVGALALLVVWGMAYGTVPACSQAWFARSAPRSAEGATVLFTASFQATFASGALLGGLVVDATSTSAVPMCAGAVALLAAAAIGLLPAPGISVGAADSAAGRAVDHASVG